MAKEDHQQTNYTQGYSRSTLSAHAARTAATDAAFLLPHLATLRPGASLLDVGCGPGTITVDLARHMPAGSTVTGIDISDEVLAIAREQLPAEGVARPGAAVTFRRMDLLAGLDGFADDSFDVVFCSQLFPHLPPPETPVRAARELRRVLRPGGVLATRDVAGMAWFPASLRLEELFSARMLRAFGHKTTTMTYPGGEMPRVLREAGFERSRMAVGAGTRVWQSHEERRFFAAGLQARLAEGNPYRQGWTRAGITEEEIGETTAALEAWIGHEDSWHVTTQSEILATK